MSELWYLGVCALCLTGILKWVFDWAAAAGENIEFDDTDDPPEEDE